MEGLLAQVLRLWLLVCSLQVQICCLMQHLPMVWPADFCSHPFAAIGCKKVKGMHAAATFSL
jgi:hypothetical protein